MNRKSDLHDKEPRIRVAIPPGETRLRLVELLSKQGVHVTGLAPDADVGEWLQSVADLDIVVVRRSDMEAGQRTAPEVLDAMGDEGPQVIVLDGDADNADTVALTASGAIAVVDPAELGERSADRLESVIRGDGLPEPDTRHHHTEPSISDFASREPAMQRLAELAERAATSDAYAFVLGETGVGKEHLARAIHAASARHDAAFVSVNCGALPEGLLESELFGHESGAFTGATDRRIGCFERADGGTLFLDEIGEMPRHLQVKLLSVLQRGELTRLGGTETLQVSVRVIAATNRDLEHAVRDGTFREDLFYRLNVLTLAIPPLRERSEDLPRLIGALLFHMRQSEDDSELRVGASALHALLRHDWPGNMRELMNVLERAALVCTGSTIRNKDLPATLLRPPPTEPTSDAGVPIEWIGKPWKEVRAAEQRRIEEAYFRALLQRNQGRVAATAREAGIAERSLYEKMRKLGLNKDDFRQS